MVTETAEIGDKFPQTVKEVRLSNNYSTNDRKVGAEVAWNKGTSMQQEGKNKDLVS